MQTTPRVGRSRALITCSRVLPALVNEEDFVAVQGIRAERDTGTPSGRRYLLTGLLRCGACGRRLESFWANNRPAYPCRHGHSSVTQPNPARPENLYIREDHSRAAVRLKLSMP